MDTTSRPEQPDAGHDDPDRATHDSEPRPRADVHVIGGGLGGLAAAAVAARSGLSVVVHERRGRLGGRATTDDRRGYRFNQGPHAFYRAGEGAAVLGRLGITPRGVAPEVSVARMVRGDESFIAPGGLSSLARTRLLGVRDKASLAMILARLSKIDPSTLAATTVGDWIDGLTDRVRVREVLHAIVRLTSYANAPAALSADVGVLQLQLGLGEGVLYLDGGWQQLVDDLAAQPNVHIDVGDSITSLDDLVGTDGVSGALGDGPAIIVTTGSPTSAAAITGHPYEDGLEATVGALDLGLARPPEHSFVIGIDEPIYLSDHGVPAGMVPAGAASVSLAEYHRVGESPGVSTDGDADAARTRLTRFAVHAGVTDDDIVEQRYLHRMVTVSSIPTAATGGLAGRPGVAVPDRPGVFVAGDWVGGRGHLADAVLASAEEAAVAAVAHVRRRTAVR
ncbi:MAG: FAD-dependent oxidoreductase [Acidimicrobiia bacterium]|nr:FAD-dependent oxidoreductase [Acidimicrobiia bacterium]